MRARRLYPVLAGVLFAGATIVVSAGTAAAAGSTLWVNGHLSQTSPKDNNCTHAGYTTVQEALAKAETLGTATIHLCPDTYTAQLQITKGASYTIEGVGATTKPTATIDLPTSTSTPPLQDSTTPCDTATGTSAYTADQDAFAICGTSPINVKLKGVAIHAAWASGTCDDSLYGILIGGGSTLTMIDSAVTAGGAVPLNGCQGGVAIQDGMAWTTPVEVGHLVMHNDTVSGYQKNGVTADGAGTTATLVNVTVTGAGGTPTTAQNGVQISNGAKGIIRKSTISTNECNLTTTTPSATPCGATSLADYQAAGVLFYGAAPGSEMVYTTVKDSDIGAYYDSAAASKPTTPGVKLNDDIFSDDRYEGILSTQGYLQANNNTLTGGNVGIQLLQYKGQQYGDHVTATNDTVTGMSVAAVQVYSDQATTGDLPGTLTLTRCQLTGNPTGASLLGSLKDNSRNYITALKKDT